MSRFFYLAHLLTNRKLKSMLIDYHDDEICFTYPKDAKKSQMFFSTRVKSEDIAETLRRNDFIQKCGEYLPEKCQNLDLGLKGSYCSADDIEINFNNLTQNRPKGLEKIFNTLFPYRTQSVNIKRKSDMIFQIFYYIIHDGRKKTPFHISLRQFMTLVDQKLLYKL